MLNQILDTKKEEVQNLTLPDERSFTRFSLYDSLKNSTRRLGLIAEVKKASPSKGIIQPNFKPVETALEYEAAGANAISVLTDRTYFKGDPLYLTQIKESVNLPIMRKDFIIDSLQIIESERIGADAILLIGEALEPEKLYEFYKIAEEKGLECLVEVHEQDILEKILAVFTPAIIGVNNRNLKTFETSLTQTEQLAKFIPASSLLVSESGIHSFEDIVTVEKAGAKAVLVGESLMRNASPGEGIKQLFGEMFNG